MEKGYSITKRCGILRSYLMIKENLIPLYCVNTIAPCHYANTVLLWKYEYVSAKVFSEQILC